MSKYVKMEKKEFAHFLWHNLSDKHSFEFGEFYDAETDTCRNRFHVMAVSVAGIAVAVCNRQSGGDPFAFDVPNRNESEDEFVDAFCAYLDEAGDYAFTSGVWRSEPIVRKSKNQVHLAMSRQEFIAAIFHAVLIAGSTDFYNHIYGDCEFFRIVPLRVGNSTIVIADSNLGGKLFCHELECESEEASLHRFAEKFDVYLTEHGVGEEITYRALNW